MDYSILRQEVELIITGLECMQDPVAEESFRKLLDDFTLRQIEKCKFKIAQRKAQRN